MNLLVIFFYMFFGQAEQQVVFDLTVNLSGIESHTGELVVSVYNNAEYFLTIGKEFRLKRFSAGEDKEVIVFKNLPKGEYALAIYQDSNADGKMNKNFIGIPKEIYGFSNNFRPMFSKPHFNDCKFKLVDNASIDIELK